MINIRLLYKKAGGDYIWLPKMENTASSWLNLNDGIYWIAGNSPVPNLPSPYGFLWKIGNNSNFSVLYFPQAFGSLYRKSGNKDTNNAWKELQYK